MPEAIIKYKNPETLKLLKGLSKYLDFKVKTEKVNKRVTLEEILISGDKTINISELEINFSGRGIDARQLREDSWKRRE